MIGRDQRAAAHTWAAHVRDVRIAVRDQLADGRVSLADVLDARHDEAVGSIHLLWALESLPGARKVDTRRRLLALGVAEQAPLVELSDDERRAVLQEFGDSPPPESVRVRGSAT